MCGWQNTGLQDLLSKNTEPISQMDDMARSDIDRESCLGNRKLRVASEYRIQVLCKAVA